MSDTKTKEPLIRIIKRDRSSFGYKVWVRAAAIILALVVDAIFIYSVTAVSYTHLIRTKSPTNCDAHLAESLFQTRSRDVYKRQVFKGPESRWCRLRTVKGIGFLYPNILGTLSNIFSGSSSHIKISMLMH